AHVLVTAEVVGQVAARPGGLLPAKGDLHRGALRSFCGRHRPLPFTLREVPRRALRTLPRKNNGGVRRSVRDLPRVLPSAPPPPRGPRPPRPRDRNPRRPENFGFGNAGAGRAYRRAIAWGNGRFPRRREALAADHRVACRYRAYEVRSMGMFKESSTSRRRAR